MSRVLILYGSTDGHTRLIAQTIGETLNRSGIGVDIVQGGTRDPRPADYDGIIVAASLHAGKYQKPVRLWVKTHAGEFGDRPAAFVPVCLAVNQKNDPKVMADLDRILQEFQVETGWQPSTVTHVAGALLYTRYNFLKRWIMKRIVAKAGGETDTSKDYVYTDWSAVRAFAEDFARRVTRAAA
jgi:menaquinone-dependent protoporphyrinogen oxidase